MIEKLQENSVKIHECDKEYDLYIVILYMLCGYVIDASSENDGAYKYTTESKCFAVKAKDYSYEMSDILLLYASASCFRFYIFAKSVCSAFIYTSQYASM